MSELVNRGLPSNCSQAVKGNFDQLTGLQHADSKVAKDTHGRF